MMSASREKMMFLLIVNTEVGISLHEYFYLYEVYQLVLNMVIGNQEMTDLMVQEW